MSFSYFRSVTDDQSIDVKKSTNKKITVPGPSVDGIDHDRDLIYLWLNPQINLSLTSSSAVWGFTGADTAEIIYVYPGWLRNPSCHKDATHPNCMPDDVRAKLKQYLVTEQDFPDILRYDVLANGSSVLDAKRFQSLNFTFPYEPPYSSTDPVPTVTITLSNSSNSTVSSKVTDDSKVGVTFHGSADFLGFAKGSVKDENAWEWTETSSQSISGGASEAATVTIGGPSFGYNGPIDVAAYFDTQYKTFVFAFVDSALFGLVGRSPPLASPPLAVSGILLDANANPVISAQVSLTADSGIKYRTLTNVRGEWRFYGAINGPCELKTAAVTRTLIDCGTRMSVVLKP